MITEQKLLKQVTKLFFRGRTQRVEIHQLLSLNYIFKEPKDIRLDSTNNSIAEFLNKRELQLISYKHSFSVLCRASWS